MQRKRWEPSPAPPWQRLWLVGLTGAWLTVLAAAAQGQVTISSPQLSVTLGPLGVQSIRLNGQPVTSAAGMSLSDDAAIAVTPDTLAVPSIAPRATVSADSEQRARVDQQFDQLHLLWTYTVSGYDLAADLAVTNTGDRPFDRFFFVLPQFQFSRPPDGTMHSWFSSYYGHQWLDLAHPSQGSPFAVSDAYDDHFGIAVHCKSHFDRPVLINSNWSNNVIPTACQPRVYVKDWVEPGATAHIQLNIRVTDKLAPRDRLGAYLDDFRAWAGPLQYEPDDRPVIGCFPENVGWISKTNPLGLDRRFDYLSGISEFEHMIEPAAPYCQGPLLWQPQGATPRGVEYRPDFDVWPPAIKQNLPALFIWCSDHGMRPGLQTRPITIVTPLSATSDQEVLLCPEEPTQVSMIVNRFAHTTAAGAREYYLDSFGADLRSYHLMKILRQKLGPHVPTYAEYSTDVLAPLTGGYVEQMNLEGGTRWMTLEQMKMFRLLYPGCSFICASRLPVDPATGLPQQPWDNYAAFKLSPLIADSAAKAAAPGLKELCEKYLDGKVWNHAAGSGLRSGG